VDVNERGQREEERKRGARIQERDGEQREGEKEMEKKKGEKEREARKIGGGKQRRTITHSDVIAGTPRTQQAPIERLSSSPSGIRSRHSGPSSRFRFAIESADFLLQSSSVMLYVSHFLFFSLSLLLFHLFSLFSISYLPLGTIPQTNRSFSSPLAISPESSYEMTRTLQTPITPSPSE
jgi:hypothetical protein